MGRWVKAPQDQGSRRVKAAAVEQGQAVLLAVEIHSSQGYGSQDRASSDRYRGLLVARSQ